MLKNQIGTSASKLLSTHWIRPGQVCWVSNYDIVKKEVVSYLAAVIQSQNIELQTVKVAYIEAIDGPTEVPINYLLLRSDESKSGAVSAGSQDNLVNLPLLNEAELMHNIKLRFLRGAIFSYIESTLLIVNPFEELPALFNASILEHFKACAKSTMYTLHVEQPHIYAIAALAYKQLYENLKPQTIVISGESGTGKTVNTKYCMSLIASLTKESAMNSSQLQQQRSPQSPEHLRNAQSFGQNTSHQLHSLAFPNSTQLSPKHNLEQMCNPILEAFGNAKTIKNDNSSRFGKFVSIYIDLRAERILGARTQSYLLEKSRVISQSKDERNYHVFYSLLMSGETQLLNRLSLHKQANGRPLKVTDFTYLNHPEAVSVSSINDQANFKEVITAIQILQLDHNIDPEYMWKMVASVLHLGNLEFTGQTDENQHCSIVEANLSGTTIQSNIDTIAELLGVSNTKLRETMLNKTIKVSGSEISSPLSKQEVISSVQTVSKDIYDKLFQWLIHGINSQLMSSEMSLSELEGQRATGKVSTIGLLDIFGFEVLQVNSFEQFCINYANEILQQLYIESTFKAESVEFAEQGLQEEFSQIPFVDNADVIAVLDKPASGIFSLIDDISALPATDESLLGKMQESQKVSPLFVLPRTKGETFIINHTPRPVTYTITGFRQKNKDEMNKSFVSLFASSTNPIVRASYTVQDAIINNYQVTKPSQGNNRVTPNMNQGTVKVPGGVGAAAAAGGGKDKFLGFKFRRQINELLKELRASDIHFIRCIKPNESKSPKIFSEEIILNQLRYLGVLDSIKIRKEGFPYRKEYKMFYRKFGEMERMKLSYVELEKRKADFSALVQQMQIWKEPEFLTNFRDQKKKVLFGKSKIFLRCHAIEQLELMYVDRLKAKITAAINIQRLVRGHQARKRVGIRRAKVKVLTRWLKSRAVRSIFLRKKDSCLKIQRFFRRKQFQDLRRRSIILQKFIKRTIGIRRYYEHMKLIVKLQRMMRIAIVTNRQKRERNFRRTMVIKGFELAWRKITARYAIILQKRVRGYLVRNVWQKDNIARRKIYMYHWRRNHAAIKIQKVIRGVLGRKYVQARQVSAFKIQGFFRSKWLVSLFSTMRAAACCIQKHYRRYGEKMRPVREFYRTQEHLLKNLNIAEQNAMISSKLVLSENAKRENTQPHLIMDSKENRLQRDLLTQQEKKISFFTMLIDFEILSDTSDIYDPLWNKQFTTLQRDLFSMNSDITQISLGEAHSLVSATNGKIYAWGWNDYSQLAMNSSVATTTTPSSEFFKNNLNDHALSEHDSAQLQHIVNQAAALAATTAASNLVNHKRPTPIPWIELINRPKSFAAGNNHTFIFDSDNNLYAAGKNNHGQLGLGHNLEVHIPERVDFRIRQDDQIKIVKTRYDASVAVSEKGTAWIWPMSPNSISAVFEPFELAFPMPQIQITTAACGLYFAVFLSASGLLFSQGENKHGELGLGDRSERSAPCLIETLRQSGEQILSVECGQKHCIARSGVSRVFTWGMGAKGQLGLDQSRQDELIPRQVTSLPKQRILQVQAGQKSSMVLLENKKMYWWGSNNRLQSQDVPIQVDLSAIDASVDWNSDQSDFHPVKIETTWSHSLSITYVKFADTRILEQNTQFKNKLISTLTTKWQESHLNYSDVPFFDSVAKYFSNRHIVKHHNLRCRQGPKYPSLGIDKYSIITKSNRPSNEEVVRAKPPAHLISNFLMPNDMLSNNHQGTFGSINNPGTLDIFENYSKTQDNKPVVLPSSLSPLQNDTNTQYQKDLISSREKANYLRTPQNYQNRLMQSMQSDDSNIDSRNASQISITDQSFQLNRQNSLTQSTTSLLQSGNQQYPLQSKQQPQSKMNGVRRTNSQLKSNNGSNTALDSHLNDSPRKASTGKSNGKTGREIGENMRIIPPRPLISASKVKSKLQVKFNEQSGASRPSSKLGAKPGTLTTGRSTSRPKSSMERLANGISSQDRTDQFGLFARSLRSKNDPYNPFDNDENDDSTSIWNNNGNDSPTSPTETMLQSLQQKLAGIKQRMQVLSRIPKEKWTEDDSNFMANISDSKMIEFFKGISGANSNRIGLQINE